VVVVLAVEIHLPRLLLEPQTQVAVVAEVELQQVGVQVVQVLSLFVTQ
jgi:hypothetical protein